jgi:hypothetical protein
MFGIEGRYAIAQECMDDIALLYSNLYFTPE